MRLVCPNCEAKYEVPDDAIPETGRDVQCANCGHAWFQNMPKPVAATTGAEVPRAGPVTSPVADSAVPTNATDDPEPEDAVEPAAPGGAAGYAVDDSVLAILRDEADREVRARKADWRPLESQPDLGLDAALVPEQTLAATLTVEDAAGKPSARRDLLPNVEEINSTLRPSDRPTLQASEAAPPVAVEKRGGFRSGFLAVMALSILGAAFYISAPHLGSAVPALAEPLDAYVSFVDGMRLRLDGLMKSATVAINGGTG